MRVLVSGAAGFVGSHVIKRLLAEGHSVHGLVRPGADSRRLDSVRPRIELVEGDLLNPQDLAPAIERVAPDACLHLAWTAEPGKYLTSPLNFEFASATVRLATLLAQHGCRRFVGVGTCLEYDADQGYLREGTTLAPTFPYSAAKVSTYLLLKQLAVTLPMSFAWARLFYLYGPTEDPRRLISSVIRSLLRGEPARCTAGRQVRDFLHVHDVARALVHITSSDVTDAVNVASGVPTTVADIVTTVGELMGRPELIELGAIQQNPRDPRFICADVRRLEGLGWTRQFDLKAGLSNTIEWWRAFERPADSRSGPIAAP